MKGLSAKQIHIGDFIPDINLVDIYGKKVTLLAETGLIHLQFRRFSGCPICNLHLQSFAKAQKQLENLRVTEIIVFHSSKRDLIKYCSEFPFTVLADPRKELYEQFGVDRSIRALADPRAWPAILKGVGFSLWEVVLHGKPMPPILPEGGSFGMPADFLIGHNGQVLDCKYGAHADDQWSLSYVTKIAREFNRVIN